MSDLVKVEEPKSKELRIAPFVQHALENLESARAYVKGLLDSKLAPNHFYELTNDRKPIYDKPKIEAALMVIQHGYEIGLTPSKALQQIIPINGLLTIKGDGAKSLIMASGKCKDWKEETSGTLEGGDYKVTITAHRKGHENPISRSFDIPKAKKAGLWNPNNQYSPWVRYPERMIYYRALGFLCRDVFPDVMWGLVTEEEAQDYNFNPPVVETERGPVQTQGSKLEKTIAKVTKIGGKKESPRKRKEINSEAIEVLQEEGSGESEDNHDNEEKIETNASEGQEQAIGVQNGGEPNGTTTTSADKGGTFTSEMLASQELSDEVPRSGAEMRKVWEFIQNQGYQSSDIKPVLKKMGSNFKDMGVMCAEATLEQVAEVLNQL